MKHHAGTPNYKSYVRQDITVCVPYRTPRITPTFGHMSGPVMAPTYCRSCGFNFPKCTVINFVGHQFCLLLLNAMDSSKYNPFAAHLLAFSLHCMSWNIYQLRLMVV